MDPITEALVNIVAPGAGATSARGSITVTDKRLLQTVLAESGVTIPTSTKKALADAVEKYQGLRAIVAENTHVQARQEYERQTAAVSEAIVSGQRAPTPRSLETIEYEHRARRESADQAIRDLAKQTEPIRQSLAELVRQAAATVATRLEQQERETADKWGHQFRPSLQLLQCQQLALAGRSKELTEAFSGSPAGLFDFVIR